MTPFVIVRVGVPLPEAYSVTEPVPFVTEVFATYTLFDASTRTKTGTVTPLLIVSVGFVTPGAYTVTVFPN